VRCPRVFSRHHIALAGLTGWRVASGFPDWSPLSEGSDLRAFPSPVGDLHSLGLRRSQTRPSVAKVSVLCRWLVRALRLPASVAFVPVDHDTRARHEASALTRAISLGRSRYPPRWGLRAYLARWGRCAGKPPSGPGRRPGAPGDHWRWRWRWRCVLLCFPPNDDGDREAGVPRLGAGER